MSPSNTLVLVLLICAAVSSVKAFTIPAAPRAPSALQAGRRDFLDAAMSATAGLVIATIPAVAGAEEEKIVDDLAMPSEEEQKKIDVSWMLLSCLQDPFGRFISLDSRSYMFDWFLPPV